MIARLQPGVTLDYAWQRLDVVNKRTTERLPKLRKLVEDAKFQTKIAGMRDELVKNVLPTLYPVAGGGSIRAADRLRQRGEPDAGARANVRMKEVAIRFGLGAGRMSDGAAASHREPDAGGSGWVGGLCRAARAS